MLLTFCSKLVIITVVPVLVQCVLPKLPQQCFISSSITTRNFEAKTFTEVTSARFFLIHADNFTIQFYNKILALIHQETAAGKTQAKSDQQINNCSDAKLWQLHHWSGNISGCFKAHCKRSGKTVLRSQRQRAVKNFTNVCTLQTCIDKAGGPLNISSYDWHSLPLQWL